MSELAKALCEYQRQTGGFEADKKSTHRNVPAYASIGAVINNVKKANAFGLTFTQEVDYENDVTFVRTVMMHTSGEERISRYPIFVDDKTNSQKMGAAITYAKRYALASLFGTEKGVEDTDDDGESNGLLNDAPKQVPPKPAAATASDSVSPSDDAGHLAGGGLQPVASPLSEIADDTLVEMIKNASVEELDEVLAKVKKITVLESGWRARGGKDIQDDEVKEKFTKQKGKILNG